MLRGCRLCLALCRARSKLKHPVLVKCNQQMAFANLQIAEFCIKTTILREIEKIKITILGNRVKWSDVDAIIKEGGMSFFRLAGRGRALMTKNAFLRCGAYLRYGKHGWKNA